MSLNWPKLASLVLLWRLAAVISVCAFVPVNGLFVRTYKFSMRPLCYSKQNVICKLKDQRELSTPAYAALLYLAKFLHVFGEVSERFVSLI